jgi:energy-coupling factor transport system ATP-binding protein
MAGVMVDDVRIFLFDEPLANLDPKTGKNAIALIDDIQKNQNATIVIIEHRLEDVLYRDVDRIILINDGMITADMTPDELLSTDILDDAGIRYPLYIEALRHAGCNITKESHPAHIETMDLQPYKDKFTGWIKSVTLPPSPPASETVLSIRNVGFSYNATKQVLSGITFDVRKGEMMSIVGKNGAGKSTLAGLICGFNIQDTGLILLDGRDIRPLSVKERGERIGYVMQNPNQMICKATVKEEVGLGLAVRGVAEDEITQRVNETLKICDLYGMRNWPVSALSFGQKKRLTIASILVMDPEIIILDEPTAGQDYRRYTEIMEFLRGINRDRGVTIIMITHDMHLMLEYTSRAVVIADGHLIADDTPARILTDDEIADRAFLKRTSLYDLAKRVGIEDASDLTDRFIYFERTIRDGRPCSDI